MKNWVISIALGVIFLFIWIKLVDWDKFVLYFEKVNIKEALLFSFFYVLAYFFRSVRWRVILKPIYKMTLKESFTIFMSGMLVNYLIPVRAGEITKSLVLKSKMNIPISKSLPTIFIDKLSDFFPIILVLILTPILSVNLNTTLKTILVMLVLIFILLLFFVFFSVKYKKFAQRLIELLLIVFPKSIKDRINKFSSSFIDGMAVMHNRYLDWILVIFFTILAILSETIFVFFIFRSFSAHISFFKVLFGYTLMNLTYILPTPPAQIGSNQFMWLLIFGFGLGIDKNLASVVITFSHILTGLLIFSIGYLSFLSLGINYKNMFSYK